MLCGVPFHSAQCQDFHGITPPPSTRVQVVAEIQGELIGGNFIKDFSTKNLLIPNVIHLPGGSSKPVQYTVSVEEL